MSETTIRRLVALAYEQGWRDACDDHMAQDRDSNYPIGRGKHAGVDSLLVTLDPYDLLMLRSKAFGIQAPTAPTAAGEGERGEG